MSKIIAVCPIVNGLKYTKASLESLPSDLEILVIDNGTNDGTTEYLDDISRSRGNVAIMPQIRNLGVSGSWNLGIWTAFEMGAVYAFVINFDIVCAPDTLENLLAWSRRGLDLPSVRAVPHLTGPRPPTRSMPGDFCGFLISQMVVEKVGWFDEKFYPAYMEDLDYGMRVRQCRLSQGSCHDAVVLHERPSRAIYEGGVKQGDSFKKNSLYFHQKWGMSYEQARTTLSRSSVKPL